jgi:SEC-C motif
MADNSIEQFKTDAVAAANLFPGLHIKLCGPPALEGSITLYDESGNPADQYELRIDYQPGYPYLFPYVFETGGRIPTNIEWHVYESDGHLCICTTTDEYIKTAGGLNLTAFIQEELIPYLFNQTHRRLTGFFLHEMAHGEQGELATLKLILKTNETANIHWLLVRTLTGVYIERTSLCFCGSKLKYRYCHRSAVDKLKSLGEYKLRSLIMLVEGTREYQTAILNRRINVLQKT